MNDYTIETVWQSLSPEQEAEITSLWLEHQALPNEEQAKARLPQVALIARDHEGQVIGVSSAYEQLNPQLNNYFYYVRAFVSPTARRSSLATDMLCTLKELFEGRFRDGQNTRAIGLFMELENKQVQQTRNQAIWPTTGFVFIGTNARGDHQRVSYFADARIS